MPSLFFFFTTTFPRPSPYIKVPWQECLTFGSPLLLILSTYHVSLQNYPECWRNHSFTIGPHSGLGPGWDWGVGLGLGLGFRHCSLFRVVSLRNGIAKAIVIKQASEHYYLNHATFPFPRIASSGSCCVQQIFALFRCLPYDFLFKEKVCHIEIWTFLALF
jgi:hypothetical protein